MYLGRIVESGPVRRVLQAPAHPYTKGLLNALPKLDALDKPLTPVPGDIPSPLDHTRCREAIADLCNSSIPGRVDVVDGHVASCFAIENVSETT